MDFRPVDRFLTKPPNRFATSFWFADTFSMSSPVRIQVRAPFVRIAARSCCGACLLFFLLAAAGMPTRAQAPADPEVDRLTASAEQGDAAAQLKLGMHYYNGVGRRQRPDYEEALKWFRRAADQGNADAQDRVGMMYYFGRGVAQDYAEAARWYLLAAQAGNEHAQSQLTQMYQGGVGVPRDYQESKKWARALKAKHPDRTPIAALSLLVIGLLAALAFSVGLVALQRNLLSGSKRAIVAVFVHASGIALVLNSLVTYGFPIVFHNCAHNFLATACTQISDPHTRQIVNAIGDWSIVNLIFRFMAGIGLLLDVLAGWYLVYLFLRLFRRRPSATRLGAVPNARTGPGAGLVAGR
jgi:hypothetical protein